MDLLVQVTTAYKISPAGYVLQPYGETGLLPYKPSTPIGALDTWIVHIVPKNQSLQNPSNKINLKQVIPPFEQTLRFQVNLPRNQLYVTRVSGRCSMRDILHQACSEKNLDPSKYTLRHPKQLDKPLYDELSIAEYGHNQVTMLSIKNLPTAVLTEDILQMKKYKAQSDSGSGSAASSISPVVPVQPSKPLRKRRPAPKPPVQQRKEQSQKQQSETIICHSRTSSDSSGYHEASVLSESPDSNNSSLPDSLPRRSKLPSAETTNSRETNKLSRSLSNLHQASTSASVKSSLKPAQSVSCLAPSRKKKPAPAPPVPIAEEKEDKSATLPPCSRLMESTEERIETPVSKKPAPVRAPSPVNTVVPVTRQRISKPKAPVPRPRSTSFENTRPNQNIFDKLEVIISEKIAPQAPQSENTDSDNARLDAEIERMFDQATREHVSLESGVELSRGPSPDWNWEYRLPAPPTFRDDVTVPSLSDLNISPPLKQILFEPLGTAKELINEESETETDGLNVELNLRELETINENELIEDVYTEAEVVHRNSENVNTSSKTNNTKSTDKKSNIVNNNEINGDINHLENNKQNNVKIAEKINVSSKTSLSEIVNTKNSSDSNENIIQITPKIREESIETRIVDTKPKIVIINKKNNIEEPEPIKNGLNSKTNFKSEKVCISIKNEEPQNSGKIITKARVDRSDAIIRVNGKVERSQEQSAIINELATVISERQQKPPKEVKPEPKQDRPLSLPLDNFKITTYTSSKPVEIYKEGRTPQKAPVKESNLVVRRNSFTEEKKGSPSVKRSASAITNLQRRLELSRSNGNLLEVEETPVRHFQRNLRKTTSELSINIGTDEQKDVVRKQETGLQSLQVLRSILPQLSQSQGALNTVDQTNEKKEEKPAVHLTTWGERPKRQVSIKTDKDYVVGGTKGETTVICSTSTTTITPPPPSSTSKSITIEVVSPVTRLPVTPESPSDRTINRMPRTSVYKSMETGNTKAIKLPDLGRIPVVRGVELKKHPTTSERPPLENGFLLNGHAEKTFSQTPPWLAESRQLRPPSYLFGCEPKVYSPPPAPTPPPMFKLKPASQRELPKQSASSDPREELLSSIRNFGKSSLRKVSTR